ncbi:MAG: hypothetical protein ACPGSL_07260 [Vicingaceae bacterium]
MKQTFLLLAISFFMITSCSKDKEGCNDRRASNYDQNVVVDDGSCIFTAVTFYADSNQTNGFNFSSIDVIVNGDEIGTFNGSGFFTNGSQVCGSPNTAVFKTRGESEVRWTARINRDGGLPPIVNEGIVTDIESQGCVIQQVLP